MNEMDILWPWPAFWVHDHNTYALMPPLIMPWKILMPLIFACWSLPISRFAPRRRPSQTIDDPPTHVHVPQIRRRIAGGWNSLGLDDALVKAAETELGILPTSVQDECIPLVLGGGDVMASSETGTGKTAAFALPILQLCHERREKEEKLPSSSRPSRQPPLRCEMSRIDRDKLISVDPSGLRVQSRDVKQWAGCRCTVGINLSQVSKKAEHSYYYEVEIKDEGIVRIGFATADGSLNLGTDDGGWGYGGTGMIAHQNKFEAYEEPEENRGQNVSFGKGDVIGCLLRVSGGDQKNSATGGAIYFTKNGRMIGKAFDVCMSKKAKEAGPLCLFPAVSLKNAECAINFSGEGFLYPPAQDGTCTAFGSITTSSGRIFNPRSVEMGADSLGGPFAIVIEPTRDLAMQTAQTFEKLSFGLSDPKVKTVLLVGGINPKETLEKLNQYDVDILVATPPICASYIKQGKVQTGTCRLLLLDEADKLVRSNDFLDDVMSIYSRLPKASMDVFDRLQVCFFSATLHSKQVKDLSSMLCHRPLWVDLRGRNDSRLPSTVHHAIVTVDPNQYDNFLAQRGSDGELKVQTDAVHRGGELERTTDWSELSPEDVLSERIKLMKPHVLLDLLERFEMDACLVFCRTNLDCDNLEKFLRSAATKSAVKDKYSCKVLAGQRTMQERKASLKSFKDGEVRVLIATDVAARGLDISELPFVVNMMLPDDAVETYVHRVGRVGRAERIGLAISIVSTEAEKVWFCQNDKKPPCEDTRLFDKGGNCKWLDDIKLFKPIEKLLQKNKVGCTKLSSIDTNIPADMEGLIKGKKYGDYSGESSSIDPELSAHFDELSSLVKELSAVEFALQGDFIRSTMGTM